MKRAITSGVLKTRQMSVDLIEMIQCFDSFFSKSLKTNHASCWKAKTIVGLVSNVLLVNVITIVHNATNPFTLVDE